jgi:hypothetical protein
MNTLKMGQAGNGASSPEGAGDSLMDRAAQHSCEALAIARDAWEHTRSMVTFPGLQTRAKPQSLRVAIKVKGKILFVNLRDVVSVHANGRILPANRGRQGIYRHTHL